MRLLNYWPTVSEINNCIKSEAESASDEVLLAVHQQFPLAVSKVGADGRVEPNSKTQATEEDLLHHLLSDAPEGSLVVPITGKSGVGKSHLIRMLDARLRHMPNADRYLIIRIPKSASLRRVVELILEAEPLQYGQYDNVRTEFNKALADIPLREAVILFQAQLKIALDDYASILKIRLQQDQMNKNLKERLHVALKIPHFLSDDITENYFHSEVFPRIIQRSVEGTAGEIDPTNNQFKADDFNLPDSLDIGRASLASQNFYKLILLARGGHGKEVAADVLNKVVDQATRQLYQLNQSLGGKTLSEVIEEIRRLLFAENQARELIILVEDFAALIGIQDTLAKILIQHGEMDGRQTLVTIRSAIAVTDGYLAGRDTLATRAGKEWVVESDLETEKEALKRTKMLVASYLNAARYGEKQLKEYYQKLFSERKSIELAQWTPPLFTDDDGSEETQLQAFGYEDKVPLFPFTELSIENLARSTLTSGSSLTFNPRFVIKNVIREILVFGRKAFEEGVFPPPDITGMPASAEVASWLASMKISGEQRKRCERFVTIWANNPNNLSQVAAIPNEIFDLFGLQKSGLENTTPEIKKKKIEPASPTHRGKASSQVNTVDEYRKSLEKWVQNEVLLDQKIANNIRQSLANLINQRIDWNVERIQKQDIKNTDFSIPKSGGEGNVSKSAILVAQSNQDGDGRLRKELLALLRYQEFKKANIDYEDMDSDLANIANLVSRLIPKALEIIRASVSNELQPVIVALRTNNALFGRMYGNKPSLRKMSSFLFDDVDDLKPLPLEASQAYKEWIELRENAVKAKSILTQILLGMSGCFQGTGKTVNGVDIVRIVEAIPIEYKIFDSEVFRQLPKDIRPLLQTIVVGKVNVRLKKVIHEAKQVQNLVVMEFGPDFRKNEVIALFKELIDLHKKAGSWNLEFTPNKFISICNEFRETSIKESLSCLGKILELDSGNSFELNKQIALCAQMPLHPFIKVQEFISHANKVLQLAERNVKALEIQFEGVDPAEKANDLLVNIKSLEDDLELL